MKSIVIERPGELQVQDRPELTPAAGEVRVKVQYASICGSDVHIWHGHNPFARYPIRPFVATDWPANAAVTGVTAKLTSTAAN